MSGTRRPFRVSDYGGRTVRVSAWPSVYTSEDWRREPGFGQYHVHKDYAALTEYIDILANDLWRNCGADLMRQFRRGAGFVYAITSKRCVKFGRGLNPRSRLGSCQVGNPERLTLHWTRRVAFPAMAERTLHEVFRHSRASGEWFGRNREVERFLRAPDKEFRDIYPRRDEMEFFFAAHDLYLRRGWNGHDLRQARETVWRLCDLGATEDDACLAMAKELSGVELHAGTTLANALRGAA